MNDRLPEQDSRSDEEIVASALRRDADSNEYWDEVRILQYRMDASLLVKMRDLMAKPDWQKRQLAADVVAQGRVPDKKIDGECVRFLLDALEIEKSLRVLDAICSALGHHKSADAIAPVVKLQTHPDPDVRMAVVHALLCQDDPIAIAALVSLSSDSDRDVRNWATFGLGSMTEADSCQLREALVARLAEADEEIAGEAIVGLALRGDTRVAKPLLEAINAICEGHSEFGSLIIEAIAAVRVAASKNPDHLWLPILSRCDELELGEPAV